MKNIGIIDIGSNSIRYVLVEITGNNTYKIIDEKKVAVRLGMDISPQGELAPIRMQYAREVLSAFKAQFEALGVLNVFAIATEAVRKASNQIDFINMISSSLNIDIRVLTGREEANYAYYGVVSTMGLSNGLIMDLGGCSTEIIWVHNGQIREYVSLPYGAINITKQFDLTHELNPVSENELNKYLFLQYSKFPWLTSAHNLPLVGVGGTARNIGKISCKFYNNPIEIIHNYRMETKEVIDIYNSIKYVNLEQRKKLNGLSLDRADIFLGAVSIVSSIIEFCTPSEFIISSSGLKEGLIHEILLNKIIDL